MTNQDETQLTQALTDFQPTPSRRFHERMNAAPWMATPDAAPSLLNRLRATLWRPVLNTALALALLVTVVAVTPPLRAFAQEVLGLIAQEPDNTLTVEERELLEEGFGDVEWVSIDPYASALEDMESALGFEIWTPRYLLPGYQFVEAAYSPTSELTMLMYRSQISTDFDTGFNYWKQPNFTLVQQPVDQYGFLLVNVVGASAEIEVVQIGNLQGEYVEGNWCGQSSAGPMEWCPNPSTRQLVWQQGEFIFSLSTDGDPEKVESMSKKEMVGTALNLTPEYVPLSEQMR